jgi:hypothetical protein
MQNTLSKFRLYFKSIHDNQGTFSTAQTLPPTAASAINPPASIPPPNPAAWVPNAAGWIDVPFPPEGAIRMRYWYSMGPAESGLVHQVTLLACGSFPGFGPNTLTCTDGLSGNYLYSELFYGNGTSEVFQSPESSF